MVSKEENINNMLGDFIPSGLVAVDEKNKQWIVGKNICEGGCGRIYLVSNDIDKQAPDDSPYVMKVTLDFCREVSFYADFITSSTVEEFKKAKNLKDIGFPKYFGGGCLFYKEKWYWFVIIERFEADLQTILDFHKTLPYKTAYQIAIQILHVLELLHSKHYVHSDIKASNIMVGRRRPGTENQIFLVDYDLIECPTTEGCHKKYLECANPESKYVLFGTTLYTSRDSHCNAQTRRGDIESLSFNLIKWVGGQLPWKENKEDLNSLVNKKIEMMNDVPKFLNICFPDGAPPGIQEFVEYVNLLSFQEMPDFERIRGILESHLKDGYDEKATFQLQGGQFLSFNFVK